MALLYLGGEGLQVSMQLPIAVTGTIQGMLLFFLLAADVLINYRLRLLPRAPRRRRRAMHDAGDPASPSWSPRCARRRR